MRRAVPALAAILAVLIVAFAIGAQRSLVTEPSPSFDPSASAPAVDPRVAASPTATGAPTATSTPSVSSAAPSQPSSPRPTTSGVTVGAKLPASGQWALILTRSLDQSPIAPDQAIGPARLPATDEIRAVPLTARATTPRDTIYLLSFTSAVQHPTRGAIGVDNLLREQFSQDGHRLVLSVVTGEASSARATLVVVDLVAGTATLLTVDPAFDDLQPAWSPKGEEIAFVRRNVGGTPGQENDAGIWVVRADGTGMRRVLDGARSPESSGVYSWNGDGTAIGYARGFEGSTYNVLDLATGRTAAVGSHSAQARAMADWRTETPCFVGAFMEGQYGGKQYLVAAESQNGGGSRDVLVGAASDGNTFFGQARWRPGSNDVLYLVSRASDGPSAYRVLVTDSSGRSPRQVVASGIPVVATWTSDGLEIVYLRGLGVGGDLHLIAPDGSNDRVVQAYGGAPEAELRWLDLAVLSL